MSEYGAAAAILQIDDGLHVLAFKERISDLLLTLFLTQESAHLILLTLHADYELRIILVDIGLKRDWHTVLLQGLFGRRPAEACNVWETKDIAAQVVFHPLLACWIRWISGAELSARFQERLGKLPVLNHPIACNLGDC